MRPESAAKIAAFPNPAEPSTDPVAPLVPDPLHAFASEDDPSAETGGQTPRRGPSNSSWRRLGVAALIVACVLQAGLIAYWYLAGRALPETGTLAITSDPSGQPVAVNGEARGATPLTLSLASGPQLIAVGTGDRARTQSVEVPRGSQASVHLALAAPPVSSTTGSLEITTDPAGARVWVDDQPRGVTPTLVSDLAPGAHAVRVTGATGTVNRTVTVEAGRVGSLVVSLTSSGAFASGWIAVTTPIGVQILEGGTLLGTSDTARLLLPAGRHVLEFANPSLGFTATRTVQITPGQTVSVALDVPRGVLHVNALPWAEVFIDGRAAGETPLGNLSLPLGTHEIVFRHPELGERRRTVVISLRAPTRIGVDLRKELQ